MSKKIWLAAVQIIVSLSNLCPKNENIARLRSCQNPVSEAKQRMHEDILAQRGTGTRNENFTLTFPRATAIDTKELSDFLDFFHLAYNVSLGIEELTKECSRPLVITAKIVGTALEESIQKERKGIFTGLDIEGISFNSPLEITFIGVSSALALAVIFSGGEVEIKATGIKAKLPSLGKGIENFRKAFQNKGSRGGRRARGDTPDLPE